MCALTIWVSLCLLYAIVPFSTSREFQKCERYYSKMGCVKEDNTDMTLLVNDRSIIDWYKFPETLHSLSCTCSQRARAAGYKYFSIRFWAECWVGKDLPAIKKVLKDDSKKSNTCVGGDYKQCNHGAAGECAGTNMVEYVYLVEPPVDGGFSKWDSWSKCDKPCGGGFMTRSRQCNNPAPKFGGKDCIGPRSEKKACNTQGCPVNGGLSAWTPWSECNKPCGGGVTMRSRQCNNPPPQNGGKDCTGNLSEQKPCNAQPCPVDGGLSAWTGWSGCSKSCDWGTKTRQRSCTNPAPAHGGKPCSGQLTESSGCYLRKCGCSNSYRFLGRSKSCGPKYTHQRGRCDGWQRMGLSRCKQMCNQNAAPGGCPRQKCYFVIWDTNPGTPPGWCQLGTKNCRQHGANGGHHLFARNC